MVKDKRVERPAGGHRQIGGEHFADVHIGLGAGGKRRVIKGVTQVTQALTRNIGQERVTKGGLRGNSIERVITGTDAPRDDALSARVDRQREG